MGCAAPNALHWMDLRDRDSAEILRHEGVSLSGDGNGYEVSFLDAALFCGCGKRARCRVDAQAGANAYGRISDPFDQVSRLAVYGGPLDGKQVSEKDFPGGVTFFQGPHDAAHRGTCEAVRQ